MTAPNPHLEPSETPLWRKCAAFVSAVIGLLTALPGVALARVLVVGKMPDAAVQIYFLCSTAAGIAWLLAVYFWLRRPWWQASIITVVGIVVFVVGLPDR